MNKSEIKIIDQRIANILNSILKLQGELDGLRFTRKLLELPEKQDEATLDATPRPNRIFKLPHQVELTVRSLTLQVVQENPTGLGYRDICEKVEQKAGKAISPKTVSSSLDALKKRKQVVADKGRYLPIGKEFVA